MNRIDRLTAILIQLQSKKIVKAQEIAERFDISLRTVYRDIRALEEAGIPLYGEAGVGYSLVEGYRLPPVMFTREEASALLFGEKFVKQLSDQSIQQEFDSAMYKIKSVLHTGDKDHLEQLDTVVTVKTASVSIDEDESNYLSTLQKALVAAESLEIAYLSGYKEESSKRAIDPIGLCHYNNAWHLIAYCQLRKDYRDFRVNRIQSIYHSGNTFDRAAYMTLAAYFEKMPQQEGLERVVVRFEQAALRFFTNRKYHFGYVSEEVLEDGSVRIQFVTTNLKEFGKWLLLFGKSVVIEEPTIMRGLILAFIEEMNAHYNYEF